MVDGFLLMAVAQLLSYVLKISIKFITFAYLDNIINKVSTTYLP